MSNVNQAFVKAFQQNRSADAGSSAAPFVPPTCPMGHSAKASLHAGTSAVNPDPNEPSQQPVRYVPAPQLEFMQTVDHLLAPATERSSVYEDRATVTNGSPADRSPCRADGSHETAISAENENSYPEQFQPNWEVDQFGHSEIGDRLLYDPRDLLSSVARAILDTAAGGTRVVAVTSCGRAEGRKTVIGLAAQRIAVENRSVAVVDADWEKAGLATHFNIQPQAGWMDSMPGDLNLAAAGIVSVQDQFTLVPLQTPVSAADRPAARDALGRLVTEQLHYFDLVLVDVGPLSPECAEELGEGLGKCSPAALLVRSTQHTPETWIHDAMQLLASANVNVLGIVENFSGTPQPDPVTA